MIEKYSKEIRFDPHLSSKVLIVCTCSTTVYSKENIKYIIYVQIFLSKQFHSLITHERIQQCK